MGLRFGRKIDWDDGICIKCGMGNQMGFVTPPPLPFMILYCSFFVVVIVVVLAVVVIVVL